MSFSFLSVCRPDNLPYDSLGNRRSRLLDSVESSPPTPLGPVGVVPVVIGGSPCAVESPKSPDGPVAVDHQSHMIATSIPCTSESPTTPPSLVGISNTNTTPEQSVESWKAAKFHGEHRATHCFDILL